MVVPPSRDAISIVGSTPRPLWDPWREGRGTLVPSPAGTFGDILPAGGHAMARRRPQHTKPRTRAARHAAKPRPSRVRIVVADSQAIDRGGLVGLLEDEADFEVVGEAATVEEAIRQCEALKPHVLLLSLNLPDQKEDAAIPTIRAALPKLRIVALSERGAERCLVLNPPYRKQTAAELQLICAVGMDCLHLA